LALGHDQAKILLESLESVGVLEAFALSTCNRIEVYFVGRDPGVLRPTLSRLCGVDLASLNESSYCLNGLEVVGHLFAVASGLRSVAIGESEILGQLKAAYQFAKAHGSTGKLLDPLVQRTLRAAKRIRNESGLGRRGLSLGSATVKKALALSHDSHGTAHRSILILGAGQIAQSVVKNLRHKNVDRVQICSWTLERAEELATAHGYKATPWEELSLALGESNIVITAVSVEQPVITEAMMRETVRPGTILIDLGIPANIAHEAAREGLRLVALEELLQEVQANSAQIASLTPKAEAVLQDELKNYAHELTEREVAPCIEALVSHSERVRKQNLEWALDQIPVENYRERKLLEDLSIRIARGMVQKPIQNLKSNFRDPEERAVLARFLEAES
jgi:glutamyl-tRNA reductase